MDAKVTPAYVAAKKGHIKCLQVLIAAGADLYSQDSDGLTAAYVASREGKTARLLRKEGFDGQYGLRIGFRLATLRPRLAGGCKTARVGLCVRRGRLNGLSKQKLEGRIGKPENTINNNNMQHIYIIQRGRARSR